mmetsp:Transcript_76871/g.121368  ORF Transcript_76871/g.121368 Transcript_76871/m.121368 type:complete len:101 (-) Transcript_76871:12-314(-)
MRDYEAKDVPLHKSPTWCLSQRIMLAKLSKAKPTGSSLNQNAALKASLIKTSTILNERSYGDANSLKCYHGITCSHKLLNRRRTAFGREGGSGDVGGFGM